MAEHPSFPACSSWTLTVTMGSLREAMRPRASMGCLQDVHWSAGLIGYFPTYALGNMYAAHFFNAADSELGGLDDLIARGEFGPLKEWLNQKIHQHGKRYRANRLLEVVTGETLSHVPLVDQLNRKYGELYNL